MVLLDHAEIKDKSSVPLTAAASVQEITVLLADMEGFSGLPERLGVDAVRFLAEYFDLMSDQIQAHGGTITEFVGDTVVAYWNAPEHAANACRAAVACQKALQQTTHVSGNTLKARIGINSGSAVLGNRGSSTQRSFTIMGASRNRPFAANFLRDPAGWDSCRLTCQCHRDRYRR